MTLYFRNKSPLVAAVQTLALLLLFAFCTVSHGDEISPATGPGDVIREVTSEIMALVSEAPDYYDDDPDRYISAVGKQLDSVVDFRVLRGALWVSMRAVRAINLCLTTGETHCVPS